VYYKDKCYYRGNVVRNVYYRENAAIENENKKNVIIKGTSYEAYAIEKVLLPEKRRKTKAIILLPGAEVKGILLLGERRTRRIL